MAYFNGWIHGNLTAKKDFKKIIELFLHYAESISRLKSRIMVFVTLNQTGWESWVGKMIISIFNLWEIPEKCIYNLYNDVSRIDTSSADISQLIIVFTGLIEIFWFSKPSQISSLYIACG